MSKEVTVAIVRSIKNLEQSTQILWHGGEPLACGISRFTELIEPFEKLRKTGKIRHSLQSNGTLISEKWCDFLKHYEFSVGVSIDGPRENNSRRVDWRGKSTFDAALRGIHKLHEHDIPVRIIAVVSNVNVSNPQAFYDFFKDLGCKSLAINIEEQEGLYRDGRVVSEDWVRMFWSGLFTAWKKNPELEIREFDRAIGWLQSSQNDKDSVRTTKSNLWPTVATNGDVVVSAPELMAAKPEELARFVVGNVLLTSLPDIVRRAKSVWYISSFREGIAKCADVCPYFSYCGGGHASNKYYETGRFDVTETNHCRNHEIAVVESVLAGFGV